MDMNQIITIFLSVCSSYSDGALKEKCVNDYSACYFKHPQSAIALQDCLASPNRKPTVGGK